MNKGLQNTSNTNKKTVSNLEISYSDIEMKYSPLLKDLYVYILE